MKLLFIIAHRYYRTHQSLLELYINNIQFFYKNEADILIVDNNSKYIDDIKLIISKPIISKYNNVNLIINTSDSKYELGAYRFGVKYIGDDINKYDYIIFTQDTFILRKKYNFAELESNNIKACPILEYTNTPFDINYYKSHRKILEPINLFNKLDEITFCYCNSFILHKSVIDDFIKYTNHIIMTIRGDSEAFEIYFPRILYELNNHKNYNIDGIVNFIEYKIQKNFYFKNHKHYFQKTAQQKREETTPDI